MRLDTHFFDTQAAEAIGVDNGKPITIILTLPHGYVENDNVGLHQRRRITVYLKLTLFVIQSPKIEVKQHANPCFGIEFQLTQIGIVRSNVLCDLRF